MTKKTVSIFVSATAEVAHERRVAQIVIARLRQEYGDRLKIVEGECDFDFQDCCMDPASADACIFIFGSRLPLPNPRHDLHGPTHAPLSDIEWQFGQAMAAAGARGTNVFVFRKVNSDAKLPVGRNTKQTAEQAEKMRSFWSEWFVDGSGSYKNAWQPFDSIEAFELMVEPCLRQICDLPTGGTERLTFISYATEDTASVMAIVTQLESSGMRCWIAPRDVPGGTSYQDEIVLALDRVKAMVLIFSAAANNSDEIKKELSVASARGLLVIPVRIEDAEPQRGLRYELANRQWIDLFPNGFGDINRVITVLKAHFTRY